MLATSTLGVFFWAFVIGLPLVAVVTYIQTTYIFNRRRKLIERAIIEALERRDNERN